MNQTWQSKLTTDRINFLTEELRNGGRGLTFQELKALTVKKVPGSLQLPEKLVKKVVYATEQGIEVKTPEEAWKVQLPWSRGMTKWANEREKKRLAFLKQNDSRAKYNAKLKKLGVKSLGVGKGRKKMHPIEAITKAQEASLGSIISNMAELPDELKDALNELGSAMKKHKLCKAELTVRGDGLYGNLEQEPQKLIFRL